MEHLGVELCAEDRLRARDIIGSVLHCFGGSNTDGSFRQFGNTVAVRHPYLRALVKALEERVLAVGILELLTAVFTRSCALYFAAVAVTNQLCTIADTQYRQTPADAAQVHMKGILLIDAQGRTAQNHAYHVLVVLRILVVRQYLAEGVQLADATTYQLCGLAAEV